MEHQNCCKENSPSLFYEKVVELAKKTLREALKTVRSDIFIIQQQERTLLNKNLFYTEAQHK